MHRIPEIVTAAAVLLAAAVAALAYRALVAYGSRAIASDWRATHER